MIAMLVLPLALRQKEKNMTDSLLIERTQEAQEPPLLIHSILQAGLRKAPLQEIHYADISHYTYADLGKRVAQLANLLASAGVAPGKTVAVMDWDSHRYLEAFFAVPMMGAVLHTVNVRLSPEQILYTINHAEDDVILINSEFLPVLDAIKDRIETAKTLILFTDDQTPVPDDDRWLGEYESLMEKQAPSFDWPTLDEDTRATTFYTSGTTGLPKGVYFSHRQLVLHTLAGTNTMAGVGQGKLNDKDVYMPITPMFHVHAWGIPYMATLLGIKQVYPGRYIPERLLKLFVINKVTFSHCVPTIIQMLLSSQAAEKVDLSGWKVIIGGSALAPALAKKGLDRGMDIFTGYGMSETCPLVTMATLTPELQQASLEEQITYRCRAGRPVMMAQVQIWNSEGKPQPHDGKSQGEIVLRTPWLTQGYFKDPANSKALWNGGWLHTGDIGVIDELGYLKITDRIKDVIKTGGEWVSSIEVEAVLLKHPAVAEVAVVGVEDIKWGERPVALVVREPDQAIDEKELRDFAKQATESGALSRYGIPERVIFVDELPKTSVGKLDKKKMRAEMV
jgi:fatty-acyl-CoA synthase